MAGDQIATTTENDLRTLSEELTEVREGECLLCYVYRMLEFGCRGLRWASHYRDVRAPRATRLERALQQMGGYCDCEIFMNAYQPAPELWVRPHPYRDDVLAGDGGEDVGDDSFDDDSFDDGLYEDDLDYPESMPPCRDDQTGATAGCSLWVPAS